MVVAGSEESSNLSVLVQHLMNDGYVVVPNFIDENFCDRAVDAAKEFLNRFPDQGNHEVSVGASVNQGSAFLGLNSVDDFCRYGKPVVYNRRGEGFDEGFQDIFNGHLLEPSCREAFDNSFVSPLIQLLTNRLNGRESQLLTTHIYVTKGLTVPRGLHFDSHAPLFKAFIYLTDVELRNGPFSYVPGSHHPQFKERVMRLNLSWERQYQRPLRYGTAAYSEAYSPVNLTGGKGTLIIANQMGLHCGQSQDADAERYMLVGRFQ